MVMLPYVGPKCSNIKLVWRSWNVITVHFSTSDIFQRSSTVSIFFFLDCLFSIDLIPLPPNVRDSI